MLSDLETAPIAEPLRATLRFLRKVTKEHASVTAEDIKTLLAAGVTRGQIKDALAVGFAFNVITRLADTFKFEMRCEVVRRRSPAGEEQKVKAKYPDLQLEILPQLGADAAFPQPP